MMRVQSVLCPVDFSEHSRCALEYAVALAAACRAQLTVLTVVDPLLAQAAVVSADTDYLRDTKAALQAFANEPLPGRVAWAPSPKLVVTVGHPGDQILEVAANHEADLIVMGTQGLGGFRKLVFGSTTERVLRRTTVPVLAVPLGGAPLVRLDPEGPVFRIERLLAAVDFRDGMLALARLAADVAREFRASLLVAHVVPAVQAPEAWHATRDAATALKVATAEAGLADLAAQIENGSGIETAVVVGHPPDALVELADESGADAIVIGTGTGSQGSHRPGSTAYRLLGLSELPVLAVPPVRAERVGADRTAAANHASA
jgi:nucleotide-binding universal stress UspA family protein